MAEFTSGRSTDIAPLKWWIIAPAFSETLQALAALRKSVLEESQKISERAQMLAGSLWKDLALAAAPFVIKVAADSANAPNDTIAGGLAFVAALFLLFAYAMQNYINYRFFRSQKNSRQAWNNALNTVLSQAELREFAEKPIEVGVRDYITVAVWVGLFYAGLIISLVLFGSLSLNMITVAEIQHWIGSAPASAVVGTAL